MLPLSLSTHRDSGETTWRPSHHASVCRSGVLCARSQAFAWEPLQQMMDSSDHDPFAASTSAAQGTGSGSINNNDSNSGHGGSRTFSASDIHTQGASRQFSDLERAMAVTSPVIERANPLSMHVGSKQRRKTRTVLDTPSNLGNADRKGKAAANGEEAPDSSSGEETALEPREAIRQQFQVSKRRHWKPTSHHY